MVHTVVERPSALMPTLTRWWEPLRAPEVAKWQMKYRVDWDATDGRNGGAQRTVWVILLEMERYKYRAGEENLGAVAVTDLAKAFERVSLVVWAWATHFQFPKEDLASAVQVFRASEASAVRRMRGGATAILPGSKWSCLLLRIVLQDALCGVTKIYLR